MFYTFKLNKKILLILLGVLFSAIFLCFTLSTMLNPASTTEDNTMCLVIDAGHGGIDGGAIGVNGTKESDVNLSLAKKLNLLAQLYGERTIMTRDNDIPRTDALSYSEREELQHRTEIINSTRNAVLISIHQNCYPTSQPWGAQVLYSSSSDSKIFGLITHENIICNLEPDNRRVAEPASKKLYITSNVLCPAILVECGFMSNFSDLEKLTDDAYQTQFSSVLFASYLQYLYFPK